ncbi:hypothetical protein F3C99_11445 [Vitellibacter sp. q18]|nr:hypothetical protein [Aequorivita lutea]
MREDWIKCKFDDIVEIVSGKNQKAVESNDGEYPIYGSGGIIGRANNYLSRENSTIIGRKGNINSPIYVKEKFWNIDTAFGLESKIILDSKLLYYFCIGYNFKQLDKSTAVPSLAKRDILNIEFPLPPLPEQRAIVAKIEQLLSELDNGIANLKTAQEQLKVYRQAVLKKAFEGELTNNKKREEDILIAAEPDVGYGKTKLPYGWKEYSFKEILVLRKDKHKPENVERIFYIGLEHIEKETGKLTDNVGVEEIKTVKNKFYKDDILYGKLRPYLNKAYLAKEDGVCSTDILVFKPTDRVLGNLIIHYFLGREFVNDMSENTSGVNLPRVSTKYVENHKINLPNIKEQLQIVQQIESRLSVCDKVEETITENLQKAEALRQSILKKSFAGELLTEAEITACKKEKDWEPAGELLKRIRKEKTI